MLGHTGRTSTHAMQCFACFEKEQEFNLTHSTCSI